MGLGLDGRASVLSQDQRLGDPVPAPNGKLLGYSLTEVQSDLAIIENL